MKFAIGYQQPENGEAFAEIVNDYRDHIVEIYFPWVGAASGRAALGKRRGAADWTAQARLEEELIAIRQMGVKLDLLFNANCYGGRGVSQSLENEICAIVDHIGSTAGDLEIVTTTSLFIARTIKRHFPSVEVRASVNMRIGETQAMEYVSGLFDSFYLRRDRQRDLAYVKQVKAWCDQHNKGLCLLANSGCLYACPGQSFHDNLVAHDAEVDELKNVPDWNPHVCWHLYRNPEEWVNILRSTWIRPEDLHHYEGLPKVVKLATRQHSHPRLVIAAYVRGKCDGDLLALLEPGFGPALTPKYLANNQFPADWFEKTSTCGRACDTCGYCPAVLKQVLREHGQG